MRAAVLVRLVLTGLIAVWYIPWFPRQPANSLDLNWRLGLQVGFERGFVFGHDLAFTFGPLGGVAVWQYWPSTYLLSIGFWAVCAALSAWLLFSAVEGWAAWLAASVALIALSLTTDTALMLLPLAYALHARLAPTRTPVSMFAVCYLGALVLVKATLIPLCVASVVLGGLMRADRHELRIAADLALFAGSVALAWVAAGQPLQYFPTFVDLSAEITRGYAAAMVWPAALGKTMYLEYACIGLIALTGGVAAWAAWQIAPRRDDNRPARAAWALFLALTLFVTWRHSITRGDPEHLMLGFCLFVALLVLSLAHLDSRRSLVLLAMGACALSVAALSSRITPNVLDGSVFARIDGVKAFFETLAAGHDPRTSLDESLARARAETRSAHPELAAVSGSVDILGYDQGLLLGIDVDQWTPRPVFQSYSAYTPRLARLNADFLESDAAPEWMIAAPQTIDGRLPSMDDAFLWPVLKRRYEVVARTGDHLVLKRREAPGAATAAPTEKSTLTVDDWTTLPTLPASSIYAAIAHRRSVWETLLSVLWKPAIEFIEIERANDPARKAFRIVPEIAASSFLLSPAVQTLDEFAGWLRDESQPAAKAVRVRFVDAAGRPIPTTLTLCPDRPCR